MHDHRSPDGRGDCVRGLRSAAGPRVIAQVSLWIGVKEAHR